MDFTDIYYEQYSQNVVVLFANRFDRETVLFISPLGVNWRPNSKRSFFFNFYKTSGGLKRTLMFYRGPTKKQTYEVTPPEKLEELKS
mmetsp:Transcript_16198/g.25083  ORF Transcript_16198/g.25083 Transcript_16198/m.25083 type:complete len:87 (+) Transcript_16198:342-602(+)